MKQINHFAFLRHRKENELGQEIPAFSTEEEGQTASARKALFENAYQGQIGGTKEEWRKKSLFSN